MSRRRREKVMTDEERVDLLERLEDEIEELDLATTELGFRKYAGCVFPKVGTWPRDIVVTHVEGVKV